MSRPCCPMPHRWCAPWRSGPCRSSASTGCICQTARATSRHRERSRCAAGMGDRMNSSAVLRTGLLGPRARRAAGRTRLDHQRHKPDGGRGSRDRGHGLSRLDLRWHFPACRDAAFDGVTHVVDLGAARRGGRSGACAQHAPQLGGPGKAVHVGRLSLDDRRLWRSCGRMGGRRHAAHAQYGTRPEAGGGGDAVA